MKFELVKYLLFMILAKIAAMANCLNSVESIVAENTELKVEDLRSKSTTKDD